MIRRCGRVMKTIEGFFLIGGLFVIVGVLSARREARRARKAAQGRKLNPWS